MAHAPVSQSHYRTDSVALLTEVKIENWDEQVDDLALQLAIRREKTGLDQTLTFTPGTRLLKVDHASESGDCSYIVMDDQIEYELSEVEMKEWLAVLRRTDGKRSLNEILSELGIPASKIRKHLEEALDYGIVSLVEG